MGEDGWQPIETAPRDGTEFLGGWWFGDAFQREVVKFYARPGGVPKCIQARIRYRVDPTRWCPLPAPPSPE